MHEVYSSKNEASGFSFMSISFAIMLLITFSWPGQVQGQPDAPREYKIKAAFIYHFLEFTQWPGETQAGQQNQLYVCVLGPSPFQGALKSIDGSQVGGRRVTVRHLEETEDAQSCHAVFVSPKAPASKLLSALPSTGVLTVGESSTFTRHGGMIRFFETKNNIRFEVNLAAVQQANLKISSKMLKLARIR